MDIIVEAASFKSTTGILKIGSHIFDCTLGKNGLVYSKDKKEGDEKTPIGDFPLRQLIYRADRNPLPETALKVEELTPMTGWCEDPTHVDYNLKITLPHSSQHDHMTREDHLYDYVVVIGYNDDPVEPYKGSAIFMHLARPNFTPTAGCVGLRKEDLLTVLKHCSSSTRIKILSPEV